MLQLTPDSVAARTVMGRLQKNVIAYGENQTESNRLNELEIEKLIHSNRDPLDYIIDVMNMLDEAEVALYEAVCRGDVRPSPKQLAPLRCKYLTNKSAFLKIAPFKVEEVSLSPYILVYHDVMYESEIEILKELSMPRVNYLSPNLNLCSG